MIKLGQLFARTWRNNPVYLSKAAARHFAKGDSAAGVANLLALGDTADAAASYRLGECYENGIGAIQNFVEAVLWYERAAHQGMAGAMDRLGDIYLSGRIVGAHDLSTPTQLGSVVGAFGSNRFRPNGRSVPRDYSLALYWNKLAAEAGLAAAQARLGGQYATASGVAVNYDEAKTWFFASAQQGNAAGEFGLGVLFAGPQLGIPNKAEAAYWFDRAADQGNQAAKLCLALLLMEGQAIKADPVRAVKLLTEAAEANHTEAMFHLGQLHEAGRGTKQDLTKAETWFRRAGARRHIPALLALARLLSDVIVPPDHSSAAVILRDAADLGDARAQYMLGQIYRAGRGVLSDKAEAKRWFRKAAEQGFADAVDQLNASTPIGDCPK